MIQECETLAGCNVPEDYPANYSGYRLTGDASTRSYFRITAPSGHTLVLMKMPEPFDLKAFPYLDNYHLFREKGVPLAEIYYMAPESGLVFLQDLGDSTYYELYGSWNDQIRLHHYLKSLQYLRCVESIHPESDLAFTAERLLWELDYFRKYFLQGLRKITLSDEENAGLQQHFVKLAGELADRPRVFCHRDYHSRNLMVREDVDYVIDFQDA
ncbi:MAG TPA: phosphotransferase, partial [Acidobacteriota bacterium]|nr:phosphotransferase [Acidobacteriota bacterium]